VPFILGVCAGIDHYADHMGGPMDGMGGKFGGGLGGKPRNFDDTAAPKPQEESYKEKVKNWKSMNKKAEFIKKVRTETKDTKLTGARADRLWRHMNDLLDNGGVRFTADGITYYLPISHHLTWLPDPINEAIEFVCRFLRFYYYAALRLIHKDAADLTHDFLEALNKSGWFSLITAMCVTYIAMTSLSWLINRFSDGLWPAERALAKETRRRAEEYLAHKREL
jgi:ligand-binding SRPBCC domain-containing protein